MYRIRFPRIDRPLSRSAAAALVSVLSVVVWTGGPAEARPAGAAPAAPTPAGTVPPSLTPLPSTSAPSRVRAPVDLRVTAITSTSVTLAWTALTPGCCPIDHFEFVYHQAFDDVVYVKTVGKVTGYTLTGLRAATEYSFAVHAYDESGRISQSSNWVEVVTPATDVGPDTTPPSEPGKPTVTEVTAQTAQLSWSPSTDNVGVTGYTVYGFDGLSVSTPVATVTGTSATVPLNKRYWSLYVRARDAAGNLSPASSPVSPPPPPSLSCRATYRTSAEWTGGFVAEVAVTNTSKAPISGWALKFQFGGDQQIESAWSAAFQQSGQNVTFKPLDWNRTIAAGDTLRMGMVGRWKASNAQPAAISVNDVLCAAG